MQQVNRFYAQGSFFINRRCCCRFAMIRNGQDVTSVLEYQHKYANIKKRLHKVHLPAAKI